jgi:hypothetical protein
MCSPNPFEARQLTKSELNRNDIYMTAEPRSGRVVALVGPLRFAQWLLLAFDRHCRQCVERPRQITLHHDTTAELDFWTRHHDGSEMFWSLVPAVEPLSGSSGRTRRDTTLWSNAVQRAGIQLTFVFENEVLKQGQRIANYFRLLPHVQAGYQLPNSEHARSRVMEIFVKQPVPMTFEQLEASLNDLDSATVRSAACRLLFEGLLTFSEDLPLTRRTLLTTGTHP